MSLNDIVHYRIDSFIGSLFITSRRRATLNYIADTILAQQNIYLRFVILAFLKNSSKGIYYLFPKCYYDYRNHIFIIIWLTSVFKDQSYH